MAREELPIAMTIAGSDSGGGAGIQADLKTFAAIGVHGASAITCITAQNPREVRAVSAVPADMVLAQLHAVFDQLAPRAVKTGMLFSREIIEVVSDFLRVHPAQVVVDPVSIATSGASLLRDDALEVMKSHLLPRASLITPNVPEAEMLLGRKIGSLDQLVEAAREAAGRFQCAALVKGGHLPQGDTIIDVFFDGTEVTLLESKLVRGIATHGTGCTLSAAICAYLALGCDLRDAVSKGVEFMRQVIAAGYLAGEFFTLHQFAFRRSLR